MLIGKFERPRAFGRKYGRELGFDYHFNQKAWMRQDLFYDWLHRFDRYVSRADGRKVLLLIDNCAAHGSTNSLPRFENVEICFLPPNSTSRTQPLDAGIIAKVKAQFRRRLLGRVFENIERNSKSCYNIDILTAMRWVTEEWHALSATTITNCFDHCFREVEQDTKNEYRDLQEEVANDLTAHNINYTHLGLEALLNPEGEDRVTEEVDLEAQAMMIAGVVEESEEADGDLLHDVPKPAEELHGLALAMTALERMGYIDDHVRAALRSCQRDLRLVRVEQCRQTTMEEHFRAS